MIQVILGNKGSGKTKRLIDLANDAIKTEHGVVVFIDDDKRYMYDLRHEIRFVDASEYTGRGERSADWLYGLLSGMLSVNYDISVVMIDAFAKLANCDLNTLDTFFDKLERMSRGHNVHFVLSVSGDPAQLPEFITRYAI